MPILVSRICTKNNRKSSISHFYFHICMKSTSLRDLAKKYEINKKSQKCRQRLRGSILPAVRQSSAEELAGEHVQCELALDWVSVFILFVVLEDSTLGFYRWSRISSSSSNFTNRTHLAILERTLVHDLRRPTDPRRRQNPREASGESHSQQMIKVTILSTTRIIPIGRVSRSRRSSEPSRPSTHSQCSTVEFSSMSWADWKWV